MHVVQPCKPPISIKRIGARFTRWGMACCTASELARLTGETMTGAVTGALRERLEREHRARGAERPKC